MEDQHVRELAKELCAAQIYELFAGTTPEILNHFAFHLLCQTFVDVMSILDEKGHGVERVDGAGHIAAAFTSAL